MHGQAVRLADAQRQRAAKAQAWQGGPSPVSRD
jgi:hypothetical protein